MSANRPTLICSTNFPAGAGYAWDFIESLYAGVSDRLADRGIRTFVAYPELDEMPRSLEGATATAIAHDFRPGPDGGTRRAVELVSRLGADVLYLSDRPVWHPGYAPLRRAGVDSIIVHDHTSGTRTPPRGLRRVLKGIRTRAPGTLADQVLAVSDFVAARKVDVDLVPRDRVQRVWNSVVIPDLQRPGVVRVPPDLADELGIEPDRPLILYACRAADHKGVDHALRAFDALPRMDAARPLFVHAGDGPALAGLRALAASLENGSDVRLLGYRSDVDRLIEAATICLATSVWAEAFGLAALEPMARGRPVIASATGGLPEVVVDEVTGLLVAPGDESALTAALQRLLSNPEERTRMGTAGRERAMAHFEREAQLDELARIIGSHFPEAP
jgi:glycosyltransferase involved in cell wall biosynthesis